MQKPKRRKRTKRMQSLFCFLMRKGDELNSNEGNISYLVFECLFVRAV